MSDYNDEAVIRLGMKCIEELTEEYLSRHSKPDLESYKNYLKRHLSNDCWLRSVLDADEVIKCMDRVRQEKLRNDEVYRALCQAEEEGEANDGESLLRCGSAEKGKRV